MINAPLSCSIEGFERIQHSLFIHPDYRELQLWDGEKFSEVMKLLESKSVVIDSIVKHHVEDEGEPLYDWYVIRF
jgi:hypothetical protein